METNKTTTTHKPILRKKKPGQPLIRLLVLSAILLIVISLLIAAGAYVSFRAKSFPNIFAGDVALGNMTKEEVLNTLLANGWEERASTPLIVETYNDTVLSFDPVTAGVILSTEDAAAKAVSYGHESNIFAALLRYLRCMISPVDINAVNTSLDEAYIQSRIIACKEELDSLFGKSSYYIEVNRHGNHSEYLLHGAERLSA